MSASVLVTGVGGPAGRAVAHELLDRGHDVLGVDLRPVVLDGVRTALVPAAEDPSFATALFDLAAGTDLVVPTVSEELIVLADDWAGPPVVVGPWSGVRIASDKWLTSRVLHRAGVAVPRSVLGGTPAGWVDLVELLGAPVVSKPRRGRGGRGVVLHRDAPSGLDDGSVIQEFASGTEYCPAVYRPTGGRYTGGGRAPVVVVLEKVELARGQIGNAVSVRRTHAPDVAAVALAAVVALDLTGPADVDVRRRADGTPVVLEVNARFGAHAASTPEVLDAMLAEYLSPVVAAR